MSYEYLYMKERKAMLTSFPFHPLSRQSRVRKEGGEGVSHSDVETGPPRGDTSFRGARPSDHDSRKTRGPPAYGVALAAEGPFMDKEPV